MFPRYILFQDFLPKILQDLKKRGIYFDFWNLTPTLPFRHGHPDSVGVNVVAQLRFAIVRFWVSHLDDSIFADGDSENCSPLSYPNLLFVLTHQLLALKVSVKFSFSECSESLIYVHCYFYCFEALANKRWSLKKLPKHVEVCFTYNRTVESA